VRNSVRKQKSLRRRRRKPCDLLVAEDEGECPEGGLRHPGGELAAQPGGEPAQEGLLQPVQEHRLQHFITELN